MYYKFPVPWRQEWIWVANAGLVAVLTTWGHAYGSRQLDYGRRYRAFDNVALEIFEKLVGSLTTTVVPLALVMLACIKAARLSGLLAESSRPNWPAHEENEAIRNRVEAFWNSSEFLNCLKTALPKGEGDEKNGLDYVPYMLQNVEARRERYSRSSSAFLGLTVGASALFSLIVVFFGYNIINESAAALPRSVGQLSEALKRATDISRTLASEFQNSVEFKGHIGNHISKLEKIQSDQPTRELHQSIIAETNMARLSGDFEPLAARLKAALASEVIISAVAGSKTAELRLILVDLNDGVADLVVRKKSLPIVFASVVERAKEATEVVKKSTESPEARTVELWKRIALGIVVCTFFFAILRYFASVYREHHTQALKAERDDLELRQFVVAFKGSASTQRRDARFLQLSCAAHQISRRVSLASSLVAKRLVF